uniref:Gamma interferon inducible lysosomal thiol reductase n=1 Tax=Tetradesmus obliquus TaxID=3088 RepID=A0A383VFM5_TETOB|eukprot:jgi/Sobl393_1/9938/SZX63542.1
MLPSHTHRLGRGGKLAQFRPQLIVLSLFVVALFVLWPSVPKYPSQPAAAKPQAEGSKQQAPAAAKVAVELFVMSMCPDARFCESHFNSFIKQLPSVASVRTEYIARLEDNDTKVACMHGHRECVGNKLQMCLQAHLPADKNIAWYLDILKCQSQGDVTKIEELKTCMTASGVAADVQDRVAACAAGELGDQLLLQSAKVVKERDVHKSCTVYIAGKRRCIRDGGIWYKCPEGNSAGAFIKQICDAHKESSGSVSPECKAATAANPYVPESPKADAGRLLQGSV